MDEESTPRAVHLIQNQSNGKNQLEDKLNDDNSDSNGNTSNTCNDLIDWCKSDCREKSESESTIINGKTKPQSRQGFKMKVKCWIGAVRTRIKELSIVFIISLTVLAALKHDQLAVRKTPPPSKFFSPGTLIEDYETGSFSSLINRALESDVSFIMYYAPWDAECIKFKREFELIANHYPNQIFFAAINCWWPQGECRQRNMVHRYPSFTAYVRNAGELTYTGPLTASYIIPYLDNLIDPLSPIQDEGELLDSISKHDGVAVGYFDFNESPSPTNYDLFFKASVRSLHSDPWRRVKFSVITSRKVAHKLRIDQPSSVILYSWNSTSIVESDFKSPEALIKWIHNHLLESKNGLVEWLTPSGRKSDALASILTQSNTMVLLTPRSLIFGISPYFDILREVAMDYFNCDNSPVIKSLIHRSVLRRRATEESLIEMEEKCHELLNPTQEQHSQGSWKPSNVVQEDTCCHSQIVRWRPLGKPAEKKCYCTACIRIILSKCPSGCKKFNCLATVARYLNTFEPLEINKTASFCNEIKSTYQPKYTPYYKIEVTCSGNIPSEIGSHQYKLLADGEEGYDSEYFSSYNYIKGESIPSSKDERIEKMMKNFENQFCSRLALGLNYSDFNFPDSGEGSMSFSTQKWRGNFTGLGCSTNRTLRFIAIDSILFPGFAESLGIDVFNETHATLAFIIEEKQDSIYLLNHQLASSCCSSLTLNKRAFYEMIKNYTDNKLDRYLRSSAKAISSSEQCLNGANGQRVICVPEINSNNFKDIVLAPERDVVVMYYTPWCGYCSTVAHIYLTVAKYFHYVDGIIFSRINGDTNDLPFEYNVDKYPTIMFFPAKRKSETITFPASTAITTSNLMKFILTNAQPMIRWQISMTLCDQQCLLCNWFAYQKRSTSLFNAYKNDLHSLDFLRKQSINMKRSQKSLQKPYLDHLISDIRRKRRQMIMMSSLRNFLVKMLSDSNYRQSVMSSDDHQSLENVITDLLKPPKLISKPKSEKSTQRKKVSSSSFTSSDKVTSKSTVSKEKKKKKSKNRSKDEL